jgi:hypothetical protein
VGTFSFLADRLRVVPGHWCLFPFWAGRSHGRWVLEKALGHNADFFGRGAVQQGQCWNCWAGCCMRFQDVCLVGARQQTVQVHVFFSFRSGLMEVEGYWSRFCRVSWLQERVEREKTMEKQTTGYAKGCTTGQVIRTPWATKMWEKDGQLVSDGAIVAGESGKGKRKQK